MRSPELDSLCYLLGLGEDASPAAAQRATRQMLIGAELTGREDQQTIRGIQLVQLTCSMLMRRAGLDWVLQVRGADNYDPLTLMGCASTRIGEVASWLVQAAPDDAQAEDLRHSLAALAAPTLGRDPSEIAQSMIPKEPMPVLELACPRCGAETMCRADGGVHDAVCPDGHKWSALCGAVIHASRSLVVRDSGGKPITQYEIRYRSLDGSSTDLVLHAGSGIPLLPSDRISVVWWKGNKVHRIYNHETGRYWMVSAPFMGVA